MHKDLRRLGGVLATATTMVWGCGNASRHGASSEDAGRNATALDAGVRRDAADASILQDSTVPPDATLDSVVPPEDTGADSTAAESAAPDTGANSSEDVSAPDGANEGGMSADAADDSGGTDAGDGGDGACVTPDGGHYVALAWNEACGQPATSYTVEWGTSDGGPYPNSADAGDVCDAAACNEDATAPQLSCNYNLHGLPQGSWCIVVESCDNSGCSTPSNQACFTLPAPCP